MYPNPTSAPIIDDTTCGTLPRSSVIWLYERRIKMLPLPSAQWHHYFSFSFVIFIAFGKGWGKVICIYQGEILPVFFMRNSWNTRIVPWCLYKGSNIALVSAGKTADDSSTQRNMRKLLDCWVLLADWCNCACDALTTWMLSFVFVNITFKSSHTSPSDKINVNIWRPILRYWCTIKLAKSSDMRYLQRWCRGIKSFKKIQTYKFRIQHCWWVSKLCITSVPFHLSRWPFSKGSHPVSFRSSLCRLWNIVQEKHGWRCLLRDNFCGNVTLHLKMYDAKVFAWEIEKR